jgi:hypothetical protein
MGATVTTYVSERTIMGYIADVKKVFGWKNDALQKILDTECYVNCEGAKTQSIAEMNKCAQRAIVDEDIDGCKPPNTPQVLDAGNVR